MADDGTIDWRHGKTTRNVVSWYHTNPALSNQHCLYCGIFLGLGSSVAATLEHWIARNFVPKGTLDGPAFNFHFGACAQCNGLKAGFERHLSSVTMINGPGRLTDPRAAEAAGRKAANDFHPHQKRPMGDSHSTHTLDLPMDGVSIGIGFAAPVQAVDEQTKLLAVMQVQALFALLTSANYQQSAGMRLLLPPTPVHVLGHFNVADWGNPRALAAESRTRSWPQRAVVNTADGYFKAAMRRHETEGWFWALEWNRFMRVIGGFGPIVLAPFTDLPEEKWMYFGDWRVREEISLAEEEDFLFAPPPEQRYPPST